MNDQQLGNYKKEYGISADQILREEAEMEILDRLAKIPFGAQVAFYGGTALRLAYGSPRFSEDIDLILLKKGTFTEFKKFVMSLVDNNPGWTITDIKDKRQTMFAFLLVKEEKLKHAYSIKIETHKPKGKLRLETELMLIKSPVSMAEPLLLVPTLTELRRLKEQAIAQRKKARDIFDLWYIARSAQTNFVLPPDVPRFSRPEFKNELQVFLPKKYYPIIKQLYEQVNQLY